MARAALVLASTLLGASAAAAQVANGCAGALAFSCGAALASCTSSYPCAACETCVLGNQTALGKAGCTSPEEIAYCGTAPPLVCKHTDSRGDEYDLTGIPRVDGKFTKIHSTGTHETAWYHVGICGSPTMDPTDPTKGCLPACDPPCTESPCDCGGKKGLDIGGEGALFPFAFFSRVLAVSRGSSRSFETSLICAGFARGQPSASTIPTCTWGRSSTTRACSTARISTGPM